MGRRKREPMSEGKKNIIGMLLEEYDIRYHRPPSSADRGLAETSSGRGLSHCIYCILSKNERLFFKPLHNIVFYHCC